MKFSASVFGMALGLAFGASAQPVVSDVAIRQDAGTCLVTVDYKLSQTAIVTVDFLTNGVSIGGANFYNVAGDVHKVIEVGDGEGDTVRKIWWRADKSWSDVRLPRKLPVTARVTAWATNTPPNYMVIRIDSGTQHLPAAQRTTYYETADALPFPGGVQNDLCKKDYLVFRKCPAANVTFRCGTIKDKEAPDGSNMMMAHLVTLTNDFYIGVYEMTQRQYEHLGMSNPRPSFFTEEYEMRPVESVNMSVLRGWINYDGYNTIENGKRKYWPESGHEILEKDAGSPANALWLIRTITGQKFDLPTDAQWEFAAHAGVGGVLPDGRNLYEGDWNARVARYSRFKFSTGITVAPDNAVATTPPSAGGTAVVGSYEPNAWGIYDMTGNVMEMCLDNASAYTADPCIDPVGPPTPENKDASKNRIVRGGAYWGDAGTVLTVYRSYDNVLYDRNYVGFRLCLTLP